MLGIAKRYRFLLVTLAALIALYLVDKGSALAALRTTGYSLKEMVLVIPPIFVLLGFLDVWVQRDTMVRFMGPGSGTKGTVLSILLGSAAAGPLYGAFPIAGVFMRKGVSFFNVVVFIGAWSTTKIPMFLFELSSLGAKFAVTRLLIDIPGILLIGLILDRALPIKEKERLYAQSQGV